QSGSEVVRPGSERVRFETALFQSGSEVVRPGSERVRFETALFQSGSEVVRPGSERVRFETALFQSGSEVVRPRSERVRFETALFRPESAFVRTRTEQHGPPRKMDQKAASGHKGKGLVRFPGHHRPGRRDGAMRFQGRPRLWYPALDDGLRRHLPHPPGG